jgi:hypothetical protein
VRSLQPDLAGAREEARERRVPYLLVEGRLEVVDGAADADEHERTALMSLLAGDDAEGGGA